MTGGSDGSLREVNMRKEVALYAMFFFGLLLLFASADRASADDMTIGGQRDGHGCFIAAGYQWDESAQECMRPWSGEMQENHALEGNNIGAETTSMEDVPVRHNAPSVNLLENLFLEPLGFFQGLRTVFLWPG